MNRIKIVYKKCVLLAVMVLLLGTGCKKFLNVDSLENLSGNNFWQNKTDVENYTNGIYAQLRQALLTNYMVPAIGDWRAGYWEPYSGAPGGARTFITQLAVNNIPFIINPASTSAGSNMSYWGFPTMLSNAWTAFYKMVAASNILYQQVDEVDDASFTEEDRKKYKAEAIYLRSLAYFYLVRMFGDVPYYTNAYNTTALGKTSQITILQNCINDLKNTYVNLPWTYPDPANVAVRAMRGGDMVIMMEMNMWLATFDISNKTSYWQSTDSIGKSLINDNGGVYGLIPIQDYPTIFTGKSKEGLVELSRNANYGESGYGFDGRNYDISGYVTWGYDDASRKYSFSYIGANFMKKLYPESEADQRKTLWFSEPYSGNQNFQFYKFTDLTLANKGAYPRGSVIIYRYADVFLLEAEALNDLGETQDAINMLNVVRNRAGAKLYTTSDDLTLDDAIWQERVKEFMGESRYFFDLIRTRRIFDSKWCMYPIAAEAFQQGAWTWPIPSSATSNNPNLDISGYWN
ncbi:MULTISPECIES: RagB/SusD family nutrient uptake outer membrane protein [Chitinophagaceae]